MRSPLIVVLLSPMFGWLSLHGATTIDSTNRYAYGANVGWLDAVANTNNGAVIGQFYCSGDIYSANVGWINLGSGSPANGIQYNNTTGDCGVNQDGVGNLRGYAYGANIGWINFENIGAPKANLLTGRLSGSVWSANCGWISLSNAVAYVQTDSLSPGQLASNGLPVAWLLENFGDTSLPANLDYLGKGMTIAQDYIAGTDPNDPSSLLRITAGTFKTGGTNVSLTWSSVPTRIYYIQKIPSLDTTNWTDSGLGLIAPALSAYSTASFNDTNATSRLYRVKVALPLSQ